MSTQKGGLQGNKSMVGALGVMLTISYSVPRTDTEASDDSSSVMLATEVTQPSSGSCPGCPKTFSLISASFLQGQGLPRGLVFWWSLHILCCHWVGNTLRSHCASHGLGWCDLTPRAPRQSLQRPGILW